MVGYKKKKKKSGRKNCDDDEIVDEDAYIHDLVLKSLKVKCEMRWKVCSLVNILL
jgi:hypothetical protein